jgi:hypothetical protein
MLAMEATESHRLSPELQHTTAAAAVARAMVEPQDLVTA